MTELEKKLIQSIESNEQQMVEQLHEFCQINSGTQHLQGLARQLQALKKTYEPLADLIEIKSFKPVSVMNMQGNMIQQACGDALLIRKRPELKRRILLCGHMDTVYGEHHAFQKVTTLNGRYINGPGVADMKGGLIVMHQALQAFERLPIAKTLGWDVLINADEEIGSPASSSLLVEMAPQYQAGLVYEPAMTPEGSFAKNRKGSGKLTLIATGKSAHAGRAFDAGRNAICYLAEAITKIHALNGTRNGVTINVGKIEGGEALNVVPDKAVAQLDIRISLPDDEHWVMQQLNIIINQLKKNGYSLSVHGSFGRPVKRVCLGTQRLFDSLQLIAQSLSVHVDWKDSGGCCDGNNLAAEGLPVLDTLGVRGGNIHSSEEYILLDSLVERATLSTLLLATLAGGGLEDLKK
jgi:glutamate carboxypeptidase